MGRFRARLASSPADQKLQRQLAIALRALTEADGVAELTMRDKDNPYSRRKATEIHAAIQRALRLLSGIGYMSPRFDTTDPDLAAEHTKAGKVASKTPAKGSLNNG